MTKPERYAPTPSDMIGELYEAVMTATGCDPILEPAFGGVTIDNCADCGTETAVTTLTLGDEGRVARVGVCCMWNA